MYYFYIDSELLPITPSSLEVKINNKNETLDLMNDGEINMLKSPGLTDISFEFMIPVLTEYPFQTGKANVDKFYYTRMLENLKTRKKYFSFTVYRSSPGIQEIFNTSMDVSLEDFTIIEDADNGFDIIYKVNLKQYKPYGTKTLTIVQNSGKTTAMVNSNRETNKTSDDIPASYTAKKGDCLWSICKKFFNDGGKYKEIAKLNNISNPNLIYIGQVIKLK